MTTIHTMNSFADSFRADRYLVCSPAAFDDIVNRWTQQTGDNGLLPLRLRLGFIERIDLAEVAERLLAFIEEGARTVLLVFDPLDVAAIQMLDALPAACSEQLDLRTIDLPEARLDLRVAMNAPDQWLLERLRGASAEQGAARAVTVASTVPSTRPAWWTDYRNELTRWEKLARDAQPDGFAAEFTDYVTTPIPWDELAFGTHRAVGPVARSLEVANDWSFQRYACDGLRGDSEQDLSTPFVIEAPAGSGETWTVRRTPIAGSRAAYLIFESPADRIADYERCWIVVDAAGESYDLGLVQDDGIAEARFDDVVDLADAYVRIGRRTVNP